MYLSMKKYVREHSIKHIDVWMHASIRVKRVAAVKEDWARGKKDTRGGGGRQGGRENT